MNAAPWLRESSGHVRLARREAPGNALGGAPARHLDRAGRRRGDAPDPPGAARGGRQLQGCPPVHLSAEGALPGGGCGRRAEPRPPGREDRLRGADDADGRRGRGPELLAEATDGDPDGRSAGLRQDDRHRQARPVSARGALLDGRGGRLRRLPPGGGRAAGDGRRSGGRRGLPLEPTGPRPRPGADRRVGARAREARGQGRADRRHRRAAARGRGADGGAGQDPRRGQTAHGAAGRRCDDRSGRRQRRRALRRVRAVRRRGHEQARRRRPRRRRAVGQGGHRQADPVRLHRREARSVRALPSRPDGAADPRHGRCAEPGREGRAASSTNATRSSSSASCAATSSGWTTSSTS